MNFIKAGAILIFLFLVATVLTVKFRPQLHNPMIIEDAAFEMVEDDDTTEPTASLMPTEKPVQTVEVTQNPQVTNTQKIVYQEPQNTVKTVQQKTVQSQPKKVEVKTTTNNIDKSQSELINKVLKNAQKTETQNKEPIKKETVVVQPKTEQKTESIKLQPPEPQNKVVKVEQPAKSSSNPYMTEEEEIIAWNKWRSDIQNQIMKDSNVGNAFYGTVFSFSFIVDKFGNISNIKVSVNPSSYMDIAKNGVKPAIANLQNKPILNFPKGTRRTTTVFNGKFVISTYNKYSTPNEYSDYERVVH